MLDDKTKKAMHILRNPFGWDENEKRQAALTVCEAVERLDNAYENMKSFAETNGLNTVTTGA